MTPPSGSHPAHGDLSRFDQGSIKNAVESARKALGLPGPATKVWTSVSSVWRLGDLALKVSPLGTWAEQELALKAAWHLGKNGIPVVEPADAEMVSTDFGVVTVWKWLDHDQSRPQAEVGPLAELMSSLHRVPRAPFIELFDPFRTTSAWIGRSIESAFEDHEVDVIRSAIKRAREEIESLPRFRPGLVHGDLSTGNVLHTSDGSLVLADLKNIGWGPVIWDLADSAFHEKFFKTDVGRTQQIARACRMRGVDNEVVETLAFAKAIKATVWSVMKRTTDERALPESCRRLEILAARTNASQAAMLETPFRSLYATA